MCRWYCGWYFRLLPLRMSLFEICLLENWGASTRSTQKILHHASWHISVDAYAIRTKEWPSCLSKGYARCIREPAASSPKMWSSSLFARHSSLFHNFSGIHRLVTWSTCNITERWFQCFPFQMPNRRYITNVYGFCHFKRWKTSKPNEGRSHFEDACVYYSQGSAVVDSNCKLLPMLHP